MRLCRFQHQGNEDIGFYLNEDSLLPLQTVDEELGLTPLQFNSMLDLLPGGNLHPELHKREQQLDAEFLRDHARDQHEFKLLTPLAAPGNFLMLAGNYPQHIREGGGQAEERNRTIPYLFLKPSNTFTHPGDSVRIPAHSPHEIDWEIELGVMIGKTCSGVSEQAALDYVAGYTIVNDISDRAYRPNPERAQRPRDVFFDWQHGKWHNTFCPWGPCVLPADECFDPQDLHLVLKVNDQIEQDDNTASMIFPVAAVIEFVSRFVTLQPGDVIGTGTPAGVGKAKGRFLKSGDTLSANIASIGTLMNPVV